MPPRRRFAHVALPLPLDALYTYSIPPALASRAEAGMRVLVSFHNKLQTGYLVELLKESDYAKPLPIVDLPDGEPVLSREMLALCRWMADYYCCSLGEALHAAVPAGIAVHTKMRYTLVPEQLSSGRYTDRQKKLIAYLYKERSATDGQLAKVIGKGALSATIGPLVNRGVVVAEMLSSDVGVSIRTETYVTLANDRTPSNEELEALQRRAPRQAAVYLDLLHHPREAAASALQQKHQATLQTIKALNEKGLVRLESREVYRRPDTPGAGHISEKLRLNGEQRSALKAIADRLDEQAYQTFLLQGITGSGKTEVYLQAIEHALKQGRDAIVLVPEISLTPQTVGRFFARFQSQIAVLHSGLGAGERYDEWRRAQRGEVKIVVGARSAVFAPLPDVGMIVVDEEHDTSYKQADAPRYHARDVAIMRARNNNAVCVLGSATPSIESYYNSEIGKSVRLYLSKRATFSQLPHIRLVDMRSETRELGGKVILSRALEDAIAQRVENKEQVILLLNRRGHSPFVLCPKCSWVAVCDNCQVTMTYHQKGSYLSCHYCNARRPVPEVCDECAFQPLIFMGLGDQKAEDYLQRVFPYSVIERMDADTTSTKGAHAKILSRFSSGEIDMLIGTQMLAKGHDYPGVTLVGVISADTSLSVPDFRAAEQTFQLITQVAGRAGRGDKSGEVIVQSFRPNHYAIQASLRHDYPSFYEIEIAQRKSTGYPPYRRMANFHIESGDALLAERHAMLVHRLLREQRDALEFHGVEFMGPSPATIRRVKKKFRWNVAALSRSTKRLNALARAVRNAYEADSADRKVSLKLDLDPYGTY